VFASLLCSSFPSPIQVDYFDAFDSHIAPDQKDEDKSSPTSVGTLFFRVTAGTHAAGGVGIETDHWISSQRRLTSRVHRQTLGCLGSV